MTLYNNILYNVYYTQCNIVIHYTLKLCIMLWHVIHVSTVGGKFKRMMVVSEKALLKSFIKNRLKMIISHSVIDHVSRTVLLISWIDINFRSVKMFISNNNYCWCHSWYTNKLNTQIRTHWHTEYYIHTLKTSRKLNHSAWLPYNYIITIRI